MSFLKYMSIQGKVNELNSMKIELKSNRVRGTLLRKRIKMIEQEINNYLEAKDQPGLKYKGTAIIREVVEKRPMKRKSDARNDAIYVLERYGIHNPEKVFDEIMDARRSSPTEQSKLTFKKYKT
jgi:ABC-type dipeptide/oligopeptide/nickel transport system ATPase component